MAYLCNTVLRYLINIYFFNQQVYFSGFNYCQVNNYRFFKAMYVNGCIGDIIYWLRLLEFTWFVVDIWLSCGDRYYAGLHSATSADKYSGIE